MPGRPLSQNTEAGYCDLQAPDERRTLLAWGIYLQPKKGSTRAQLVGLTNNYVNSDTPKTRRDEPFHNSELETQERLQS